MVEALDTWIREPESAVDKPFLVAVENVSNVPGKGTRVTGRVETGIVKPGDELEIVGMIDRAQTTCTEVEALDEYASAGQAGQNVALFLSGINPENVC